MFVAVGQSGTEVLFGRSNKGVEKRDVSAHPSVLMQHPNGWICVTFFYLGFIPQIVDIFRYSLKCDNV
jgi:hypothetical protein